MKNAAIILVCLALMVVRLFIEPSHPTFADVYKDLAHVFVGWLFAMWRLNHWPTERQLYAFLFWLLCFWEVACAVLTRIF